MSYGAAPAANSSRVAVLRSIVAPPLPSRIVASAHLLRSLPGSGAGRCHQTGRGAPPPDALPDRRGRVLLPPRKLGSGRQSREGAELKLPCQACARPSARCPLPAARCSLPLPACLRHSLTSSRPDATCGEQLVPTSPATPARQSPTTAPALLLSASDPGMRYPGLPFNRT